MKKLIVAAIVSATSMIINADTTDVFDFKLSAKVPYLQKGIRVYSGQTLKGYLYITWDDNGSMVEAIAKVQNTKTKVKHTIEFNDAMYNLMGKASKKIYKSVPTITLTGCDTEVEAVSAEAHETIKSIALAGAGSLTYIKGTGCGMCGDATSDCNKIAKASGNFVGVMDCNCPDDEKWDHTLEAGECGLVIDGGDYVRSHDAAFWGSWAAQWNKKATAAYAE